MGVMNLRSHGLAMTCLVSDGTDMLKAATGHCAGVSVVGGERGC